MPSRVGIEAALIQQSGSVNSVFQRRQDYVLCILEAVNPTDFVSVVRRDRQLYNAGLRVQQLNDDFGIKVEVSRVQTKGEFLEGLNRVDAISTVKLGQLGPKEEVLNSSEDLVPDELVQRHAAPQRSEPVNHPASEHCVDLIEPQWLHQSG